MRAAVDQAPLSEALKFVSQAASARPGIPILNHIKVSAEDGCLLFSATDLDRWADARLPVEVQSFSGACIPARTLSAFCSMAPRGSEVEIEIAESAVIRAGRSKIDVPTLPQVDFPVQAADGVGEMQEIDPGVFPAALEYVGRACAAADARAYLCGVYVDGDALIATDGNRMHIADHPMRCVPSIIPREQIPPISKLLANGGRFGCDGKKWRAEASGMALSGRCIEGEYINYKKIAAQPGEATLIDRDELLGAIDLATVKEAHSVILNLADNELAISARGVVGKSSNGSGEARINAEGPNVRAGIKARYLREAVSGMPELLSVTLRAVEDGPTIIEPTQSSLLGLRAVVQGYRT